MVVDGRRMDSGLRERFWERVHKTASCWLWMGEVGIDGYGRFRPWRAHRVAWQLTRGPIPPGMFVCHACDAGCPPGEIAYRLCVNPGHLFLGTHNENMADMVAKGRSNAGDRHGMRTQPHRAPRGERQGRHKLTEAQVRTIFARAIAGKESLRHIAAEYGVAPTLISKIKLGQKWAHLELTPKANDGAGLAG